jgi:signal transduction histidine kinase/DNA-binding NarL/FixJ family response regulator
MRTILLLTKQPSFASAVQAVLDPTQFQFISKQEIGEAEFLLSRGAVDATILDLKLTDTRAIRTIEQIKQAAPGCPVIIYANSKQREWEEDAYLLGVEHVLDKPLRGKLLANLLARLFPAAAPVTALMAPVVPQPPSANSGARSNSDQMRALEALRRFSAILTHGLDATALLKQFLLLLREIIGVNRAIVFLRKPSANRGDGGSHDDRWLRSVCAIGLDQDVLQHFALSLNAGIGGHLHLQGRILRANTQEAQSNREIAKEFQILGVQVAIPILDRESLVGIAVFDGRLTGEPYTNEELALIFNMLEEVGIAIRNSWQHDQLVANQQMIADILSHLGSGCVVVSSNLGTLHANPSAAKIFLHDNPDKLQLEFSDLPQMLGSMVFTAIKSGVGVPPFAFQFPHAPDLHYRVGIMPFRFHGAQTPSAALLIIEDVTEHVRAQRLEIETSNLRLVKSMAEHLAHEIGNSLVPLSTHQQLLKDSIGDPEFQESLSTALAGGVKRISRLANQMVFLAREWQGDFREAVQISDIVVEAFHEAHTFHPGRKVAQLSFGKSEVPDWKITGDQKALRHAFSEIILNALQANPEDPNVEVNFRQAPHGAPGIQVEVRDSGKGFTQEIALRAPEPFFSTRNVGHGLGLTVSRKIIESHHGKIEIPTGGKTGEHGVVRILLPLEL